MDKILNQYLAHRQRSRLLHNLCMPSFFRLHRRLLAFYCHRLVPDNFDLFVYHVQRDRYSLRHVKILEDSHGQVQSISAAQTW